jgi:hypothetical protein
MFHTERKRARLRGLGHAPYPEDERRFNTAVSDFLLGA